MSQENNLFWQAALVTRQQRQDLLGHASALIWFTGLSGSGKSTLAHALDAALHQRQCLSYVLDGDNVRQGLCRDLGFSLEDRTENIRRIGEVARLFVDAGVLVSSAFISPLRADRDRVRAALPAGEFIEVYCRSSLAACEARDVKGLYAKAREGKIPEFTGISSPYEEPLSPELIVDTETHDVARCLEQILQLLRSRGVIKD